MCVQGCMRGGDDGGRACWDYQGRNATNMCGSREMTKQSLRLVLGFDPAQPLCEGRRKWANKALCSPDWLVSH